MKTIQSPNLMKLNAVRTGDFDAGTSLQLLVNRLVSSLPDNFTHNKISIVNEVPRNLQMIADEKKVTPVICQLLTTVVANARNSHIHISAERYRDIMILNIQDRNNNNGYALDFSIMSMKQQADEIGGSLSIEGKQQRVATVSFSFPNHSDIPEYTC